MKRKRIIDIALLSVGLIGLVAAAGAQIKLSQMKAGRTNGSIVAGTTIGGPFTLVDQTGTPRTQADLTGKYALMYFGFTFCPAICPTELQKMARVLEEAGLVAEKIQPVFVTVDPARDTPAVMAAYVPQFHPRLMGLTGTQEQIDSTLKAYRVFARKVQEPDATDYTMDHSSHIYLIGPGGELLGAYGITSKPADITADIARLVKP